VAAGAEVDVVQANLGHASLATTTVYVTAEMSAARRRWKRSPRSVSPPSRAAPEPSFSAMAGVGEAINGDLVGHAPAVRVDSSASVAAIGRAMAESSAVT